ncbi:MAG TPA: CHAD domain-containing protein [Solirubrobacterales bacterium]|nr:CHAD domain-containing protein [Solirubrobacterales bacterium]
MDVSSDRGRSFKLARDEGVAAGLARVAAGRAEAALERLRDATAGEADAAEAVHGARKDMKKLRTVLRLLRDELGKRAYRRENARFRDAGRALSQARDAEVKLATLNALAEEAGGLPAGAVETWRQGLESDRKAAANIGLDRAMAEAIELIQPGLASIESWQPEGDSWATIAAPLRRTYRRGRQAMKAAESSRSEDDLHEWRKRAKDLWYELRLLEAAWPQVLGATAEEAHTLAELLGEQHDLAVLCADLRERRLGEGETASLEVAIQRRQERLIDEAIPLGRRLYAEEPRDFNRRLRRYWKAFSQRN